MTRAAPHFKLGKDECETGAAKVPNADIKVIFDATSPTTDLHAPTTLGNLHLLIVKVVGVHLLSVIYRTPSIIYSAYGPGYALWPSLGCEQQPEHPTTRYIKGKTCYRPVTARRQCSYIRSAIYGTIPRMSPFSSPSTLVNPTELPRQP